MNQAAAAGAMSFLPMIATLIVGAGGWLVAWRVAKASAEITRGQLEVAHNKLVFDLLEMRIAARDEFIEAAVQRNYEVQQYKPGTLAGLPTEKSQRVYRAAEAAKVLFGPDVHEKLDSLTSVLSETAMKRGKRRADDMPLSHDDRYQWLLFQFQYDLNGVADLMNAYHYMGDIRISPRKKTRSKVEEQAAAISTLREERGLKGRVSRAKRWFRRKLSGGKKQSERTSLLNRDDNQQP